MEQFIFHLKKECTQGLPALPISLDEGYHTLSKDQELYYIKLNEKNQYRVLFISLIYAPFLFANEKALKTYSDRLIVSSPYLMDHLIKFYPYAFSLSNLELVPELLSKNKTPENRQLLEDLLRYLSESHLREVNNSLFAYKFNNHFYHELNYLSKLFEEEAAAFNFTLDETYTIKDYLINKILSLKNIYGTAEQADVEIPYSLVFLNNLLADAYFYDQEYDDAIVCYSDAASYSKAPIIESPDIIISKLKLAICFERIKDFKAAIKVHDELIQLVKLEYEQFREKAYISNLLALSCISKAFLLEKEGIDHTALIKDIAGFYNQDGLSTSTKVILLKGLSELTYYKNKHYPLLRIVFDQKFVIPYQLQPNDRLLRVKPNQEQQNAVNSITLYKELVLLMAHEAVNLPFNSKTEIWEIYNSLKNRNSRRKEISDLAKYTSALGDVYFTSIDEQGIQDTFETLEDVCKLLISGDTKRDEAEPNKKYATCCLYHYAYAAKLYQLSGYRDQKIGQYKKILIVVYELLKFYDKHTLQKDKISENCYDLATYILQKIERDTSIVNYSTLQDQIGAIPVNHDGDSRIITTANADIKETKIIICYVFDLLRSKGEAVEYKKMNDDFKRLRQDIQQSMSYTIFTRINELYLTIQLLSDDSLLEEEGFVNKLYAASQAISISQGYGQAYFPGYINLGFLFLAVAKTIESIEDKNESNHSKDLQDSISKELEKLIGYAASITFDAHKYYSLALTYLEKANEMHSQGRTYKNETLSMLFLEEDFSDPYYHFWIARERFLINNGIVEIRINEIKNKLAALK